jgi:hypothetical protein
MHARGGKEVARLKHTLATTAQSAARDCLPPGPNQTSIFRGQFCASLLANIRTEIRFGRSRKLAGQASRYPLEYMAAGSIAFRIQRVARQATEVVAN